MSMKRGAPITVAVISAAVLLVHTHRLHTRNTNALEDLRVTLSPEERAHVLGSFLACSDGNTSKAKDTVWARRAYAPMFIHRPELANYKRAIEAALPDYVVAFDVIFAAADSAVPWHCDYDSLGPFDVSFASIPRGDFVTVHANLQNRGGAKLRTLSSLPMAAAHYAVNTLTSSFGGLAALTAPFAESLGAKTHSGAEGHGHFFNNMATHAVTQGVGRVSYVVRLMRRDVVMRRELVEAASSGTLGTRRLKEFGRLLPLFAGAAMVHAGDFPWDKVSSEGASACA